MEESAEKREEKGRGGRKRERGERKEESDLGGRLT